MSCASDNGVAASHQELLMMETLSPTLLVGVVKSTWLQHRPVSRIKTEPGREKAGAGNTNGGDNPQASGGSSL